MPLATKQPERSLTLPADVRAELQSAIERFGERAVLEGTPVHKQAIYRALAGLPVRRATIAVIVMGLAKLTSKGT